MLMFYFRWPDKKYTIVCPPPSARKSREEVRAAKAAAKEARISGITAHEEEPEQDNQKGVMYHEYDLMFHYLLASLRRADGKDSVTASGTKLFNIFAGKGEHR
jgi:hypothetical protein